MVYSYPLFLLRDLYDERDTIVELFLRPGVDLAKVSTRAARGHAAALTQSRETRFARFVY